MSRESYYSIRRASVADIPVMKEIFEEAKGKMRRSGNMLQWNGDYPQRKLLEDDINSRSSYIVGREGSVVATFVLKTCPDPTYRHIYHGAWLDDVQPYGVIHRIASREGCHGVAKAVFDWCRLKIPNLRIDTHRDNCIMRHILEKYGFCYCGIIFLENGDERLAFQLLP